MKFLNSFSNIDLNHILYTQSFQPSTSLEVIKNNNKVFIIQNVDKKMPLELIARNKTLKLEELLEEMETIVASGTKLNSNM